ncbi:hypothetical protein DXG01_003648 [Tephrocybe rancida]|nr:hypothetical protein DXG01_003648 [Tephrocybe rancida]
MAQVIVGILLIMRTYALYDRSLRVLLFICSCALAAIIFGMWSVASGHGTKAIESYTPQAGCIPPVSVVDATRLANAWIGTLMFDILIFGMTMFKSWRRGHRGDRSLLYILTRDGALYFGIMAVVVLVSPEYQRGFTTILANIISSTLISRLMLNLRDPKLIGRYRTRPTHSTYPVLSTVLELNTFSDATTASTSHGLP